MSCVDIGSPYSLGLRASYKPEQKKCLIEKNTQTQQSQLNLVKVLDEEIDDVWLRYDLDDSKVLEDSELEVMFNELRKFNLGEECKPLGLEDFTMMVEAMDLDGNGTIDREEFRSYVKKYGLQKVPPFEASPTGARPEMRVK